MPHQENPIFELGDFCLQRRQPPASAVKNTRTTLVRKQNFTLEGKQKRSVARQQPPASASIKERVYESGENAQCKRIVEAAAATQEPSGNQS